jgi:hypothetical protein
MQRSPACFSQRAADHARDFREADGWLADAAQPRWPGSPRRGKVASMSDSKPLFDPEAVRKITVAFESFVRAVEECVHPVIDALVQIAQDPAFRAALAADLQPGSPACLAGVRSFTATSPASVMASLPGRFGSAT